MAIDYGTADPQDILNSLRAAYYALIAGEKEQSVEFDAGNGSRQSVTFHKADLDRLEAEIIVLEGIVSPIPKRFGLRSGGRSYSPFRRPFF